MQAPEWLPLTEFAIRSGTSISTLRRKIKMNTIEYKMDEGRYLIRCVEALSSAKEKNNAFVSSDSKPRHENFPEPARLESGLAMEEMNLRWRALEARVAGLAKKIDMYSEHLSELKMLVKIFEEKLDRRDS